MTVKLTEFRAMWRTASRHECDALIARALAKAHKDKSHQARAVLSNGDFYIHEGDLWIDDDVLIDTRLIVTGDVIINGVCTDSEGVLLVLGNMRCAHMVSDYGICVWGDLICGGLSYKYYENWSLEVLGTLSARAFISYRGCAGAGVWLTDEKGEIGCQADTVCQMLGFRDRREEDDEYYDEDEDGDEADGEGDDLRSPIPLPGDYDWHTMLEECRREGRDAFAVPFPPMAELVERWGEDWAWRKRLWYPHKAGIELTADERKMLAEKAPEWLCELIVSKNLPSAEFAGYVQHHDSRIRWALAASQNCPAVSLQTFARDDDATVRAAAAGNANCPPDLRNELMLDSDWRVRVATLYGMHAKPYHDPGVAALERLANDADARVRGVVAAIPRLSRALVAQLAEDPDSVVRARISRYQPQDVSFFERQSEDADAVVRLSVARHLFHRDPPFDQPEYQDAHNRILQKLMLDADERVREQAATFWQPFPFYDANAAVMAKDTVQKIRWVLAYNTRNQETLAQLAEDEDEYVVEAVIENCATSADILTTLCSNVLNSIEDISKTKAFEFSQHDFVKHLGDPEFSKKLHANSNRDKRLKKQFRFANALSNNLRLPTELIDALIKIERKHEREHGTRFFDKQPNLTPQQIVQRHVFDDEAKDCDCSCCDDEVTSRNAVRHKLTQLSGDAQFIDEFFRLMLECTSYRMDYRELAFMNVYCPPDELLKAVKHYIAHTSDDDRGGLEYAIEAIAANPAIPGEARTLLLEQASIHRVFEGLIRNPTVRAEEWLAIATAPDHPRPQDAAKALWAWYGQVVPD